MDFFHIEGADLLVNIKVIPGASKSECTGVKDARLRVRIAAAPEDGRANRALCAYLAAELGIAKRDIVLISGEKSREKRLRLPANCADSLRVLAAERC